MTRMSIQVPHVPGTWASSGNVGQFRALLNTDVSDQLVTKDNSRRQAILIGRR